MDTNRVDLNLLVVFDAILQERSVGGAARRLHLSQPAVSGALARLRAALDDQLFLRTKNGMMPTQRALEMGPSVSAALATLRAEMNAGRKFDPATSERTFTLLISEIGQILFLPLISQAIRGVAPGIRLVVTEAHSSSHQDAMENGGIDLAVGVWPHLRNKIVQRSLFQDGWMCVAREDHPAVGNKITMREFLSLEHVAISSASGGDGIIAKSLKKRERQSRQIALQVTDFLAALLIVSRTDLIATAPASLAEFYSQAARLKTVDVPFALPMIDLRIYSHKRAEADPGCMWLRDTIYRLLHDYKLTRTTQIFSS